MPSEASAITAQHDVYLKAGGAFKRPRGVLKIKGPDSADFLHRLSTQNIKNLSSGIGCHAALLQASGTLIALTELYNCGQFFLMIVDHEFLKTVHDHLEKYHFAEDLEIEDISSEFQFLSVQGEQASGGLKETCGRLPKEKYDIVGVERCFLMNAPDFDTVGFHLLVKADGFEKFVARLAQKKISVLSDELWQLLRAENGQPTFGIDVTEKNLILEGAFDEYVSRNKGCYPGQEAVERIFSYGNIAKKLVRLEFQTNGENREGGGTQIGNAGLSKKLFAGDQEIGTVTSTYEIPWAHKRVGFAMVRKPFYESGQKLQLVKSGSEAGGDSHNVAGVQVTVRPLPHTFDIRREISR